MPPVRAAELSSPPAVRRGPPDQAKMATRRPSAGAWPRRLRLWHLYSGVFFAPAILFLAFTGAFQVFSLHKADKASGYHPPVWMVTLAGVHKRQTLAPKPDDDPVQSAGGSHRHGGVAKTHAPVATPPAGTLVLKLFELGAALSLIGSSLSGLYLALRMARRPILILGLISAGVLIPLAALFL